MKHGAIISFVVAHGLVSGPLYAQSASSTRPVREVDDYLLIAPFYLAADEEGRGTTDDGRGMAIAYGRQWRNNLYWEVQTFGDVIETGQDPLTDFFQYAAGLDLQYRFAGSSGTFPYILFGAGVVRNDVIPDDEDATDWFANAGIGFATGRLGRTEMRLRGEARYVRDQFEWAGEDGMNDWRFSLGVQVPLGRRVVEREVVRERVVTETEPAAAIVDSDGDGVPDQMDRCPNTLAGLATDSRGCAAQSNQTLRLEGVQFEFDSDRLTPSASAMLQRVTEALRDEPDLRIEIAGHTDAQGADAYNLDLSQQRADAVVEFLTSRGIARSRLRARGYGETQPVADNDSAEGRARNRRVELRVLD